jgi:hypothetical protein
VAGLRVSGLDIEHLEALVVGKGAARGSFGSTPLPAWRSAGT